MWTSVGVAVINGAIGLIGTAIVLIVAKVVLDIRLSSLYKIDADKALTETDNPAVARLYVGYYAAVFIAFARGGLEVGPPWGGYLIHLVVAGALSIILINVALFLCDWFILTGIDDMAEMAKGNQAVANVWAGAALATGLVMNGAFAGYPVSNWGQFIYRLSLGLTWFGIGQGLFIILYRLYDLITPFKVGAELVRDSDKGRGNLAAGYEVGLVIVAFGIIVARAVSGDSGWDSFGRDIVSVLIYAGVAGVMVILIRILGNFIFIRGGHVNQEIARDQNVGVGTLSGVMFVLFAIVLTRVM